MIYEIYTELKNFIYKEVKLLFIKDPCNKCLVKACCSSICMDRREFNNLIDPYDNLRYRKIWSIVGLFSYFIVLSEVITIIVCLITKLINLIH